jgi:hypothetical protein
MAWGQDQYAGVLNGSTFATALPRTIIAIWSSLNPICYLKIDARFPRRLPGLILAALVRTASHKRTLAFMPVPAVRVAGGQLSSGFASTSADFCVYPPQKRFDIPNEQEFPEIPMAGFINWSGFRGLRGF